jgi:hypothetical protein
VGDEALGSGRTTEGAERILLERERETAAEGQKVPGGARRRWRISLRHAPIFVRRESVCSENFESGDRIRENDELGTAPEFNCLYILNQNRWILLIDLVQALCKPFAGTSGMWRFLRLSLTRSF